MTSTLLARIEKLIARAAAATVDDHEARNAALQACRLIQEHDLVLAARPPIQERVQPIRPPIYPPAPPTMRVMRRLQPETQTDVVDIVSRAAGRVVDSIVSDMLGGRRRRR